MSDRLRNALNWIRDLATPAEIRELAAKGFGPQQRPLSNGHIHLPPNFSAFETVEQAVNLARDQKIGVVGVTNYYDYAVYGDFAERARVAGIFPLFGLEVICLIDELVRSGVKINDPGNPGKFYYCGKAVTGVAAMSPRAKELLGRIRQGDTERMAAMTLKIGEVLAARGLDLRLTEEDVIAMICKRHGSPRETVTIQERHVAQAYQEALWRAVAPEKRAAALAQAFGATPKRPDDAVTVQGEIRTHLMKSGKAAFVAESFVTFDEAHELILALDGIPCYPTLADGTSPICGYEDPVEMLIADLKSRNIHAAEFIPIRNKPEVLAKYVKAMRAAGLFVVGGTEHNTLDLIPIDPKCVGGAEIPEEVRAIFWEGTCVVAAHEFLRLHGEPGFVDAQGVPNPAYATAEDRIRDFAAMGAAVIEKYFEKAKG